MRINRFEEIRKETREEIKKFLDGLPENFTIKHLEFMKVLFEEEVDKKAGRNKRKNENSLRRD